MAARGRTNHCSIAYFRLRPAWECVRARARERHRCVHTNCVRLFASWPTYLGDTFPVYSRRVCVSYATTGGKKKLRFFFPSSPPPPFLPFHLSRCPWAIIRCLGKEIFLQDCVIINCTLTFHMNGWISTRLDAYRTWIFPFRIRID